MTKYLVSVVAFMLVFIISCSDFMSNDTDSEQTQSIIGEWTVMDSSVCARAQNFLCDTTQNFAPVYDLTISEDQKFELVHVFFDEIDSIRGTWDLLSDSLYFAPTFCNTGIVQEVDSLLEPEYQEMFDAELLTFSAMVFTEKDCEASLLHRPTWPSLVLSDSTKYFTWNGHNITLSEEGQSDLVFKRQ